MSAESAKAWRERQKENAERLKKLEVAYSMSQGLLKDQSRKISELNGIIEDATEIAGEMSVLFPAKTLATSMNSRSTWDVPTFNSDASYMAIGNSRIDNTAFMRTERLSVILGRIDTDYMKSSVHFMLSFGDRKLGYAISETTLRTVPKNISFRRMSESIAKIFLQEQT